ncbi:hypothetical protein D4R71_00440 [bacterium]|nr:MAG: hypothetical protein D4R71_00440 [bacterium]
MRIKKLTWHAKRQLQERFNLRELPKGPRIFVCSESNNRKLYRIDQVYFIWSKATKKVVTFLTKEIAVKTAKFYEWMPK